MSADAVCADAARVGARTLVLRPGGETRRDAGRAGGAVGALRSIDASDAVVAPQRRSVGWCFFQFISSRYNCVLYGKNSSFLRNIEARVVKLPNQIAM